MNFTKTIVNALKHWTTDKLNKKVDKEDFIALKNAKADWNQNNENADDYIKNRPFYTDENDKTIVIRETNVTIGASERGAVANGGYTTITYSPVIELVIGQSYTVTWNGKDYECIAYEAEGIAAIGNNSMLYREDASASNEPFFIAVSKDMFGGAYISASESGTHTVKVIQRGKIVKIDKKYLPDDLITDLAPVATSGSYNDLSDTPTIYSDVVRYGTSQSLTTAQKTQARNNIGAVSSNDITGVVKYSTAQSLTDTQKEAARTNIGAGTSSFSGSYNDLTDTPEGQKILTIPNVASETYIPGNIFNFNDLSYSPIVTTIELKSDSFEEITSSTGEISYQYTGTIELEPPFLITDWGYHVIGLDDSIDVSGGFDEWLKLAYNGDTALSAIQYIFGNATLLEKPPYFFNGLSGLSNGHICMTRHRNDRFWSLYSKTNTLSKLIIIGSYKFKPYIDDNFISNKIARLTDIPYIPESNISHKTLVTNSDGEREWIDRTHYYDIDKLFLSFNYRIVSSNSKWSASSTSGSIRTFKARNEDIGLEIANTNLNALIGAVIVRYNHGKFEKHVILPKDIINNEYILAFNEDNYYIKIERSGDCTIQAEFSDFVSDSASICVCRIETRIYHPISEEYFPSSITNPEKYHIVLIDQTTNFKYRIAMRNGSLTSYAYVETITVSTLPSKTTYTVGETFDPTDMIVSAMLTDGTTKEITDYTLENTTFTTEGQATVVVSYTTEDNDAYTANVLVNVSAATE